MKLALCIALLFLGFDAGALFGCIIESKYERRLEQAIKEFDKYFKDKKENK